MSEAPELIVTNSHGNAIVTEMVPHPHDVTYIRADVCFASISADAKAHEKEIAVWAENYAALERQLAEARKVKPLEWKQAGGNIKAGHGYSAWGHLSHTPTTTYLTHNGWWLSVDCKTYPTLDAAKEAAQADYTARVLAALEQNKSET